jgi:hypothetical protein
MSEESSYLLLPGEGDRGVCGFCLHCMASMVYSLPICGFIWHIVTSHLIAFFDCVNPILRFNGAHVSNRIAQVIWLVSRRHAY